MNHAQFSADLARAIGYYKDDIGIWNVGAPYEESSGNIAWHVAANQECHVYRDEKSWHGWRAFDYRDPTVAFPLLEWLMREHDICIGWAKQWDRWCVSSLTDVSYYKDFPEAIARAVIAVKTA